MNDLQYKRLSSLLNLAQPTRTPTEVSGGLLHKIWHVVTGLNEYAIKELNLLIVLKPGVIERYRQAENIAELAIDKGIPGVKPHRYKGESVLEVEKSYFIVYDWIPGKVLTMDQIKPANANKMGEIVNQLHRLKLSPTLVDERPEKMLSDKEWSQLIKDYYHPAFPTPFSQRLGSELNNFLPEILQLKKHAEQAQFNLKDKIIVSHGDMDPKNVIWKDEEHPVIVDWESTRKINPTLEAMACALDWAGLSTGKIDFTLYLAFIEGYGRQGDLLPANELHDAFYGLVANWLAWLEFNIRRGSGELIVQEEEQALGGKLVAETLVILKCLIKNKDEIIKKSLK